MKPIDHQKRRRSSIHTPDTAAGIPRAGKARDELHIPVESLEKRADGQDSFKEKS